MGIMGKEHVCGAQHRLHAAQVAAQQALYAPNQQNPDEPPKKRPRGRPLGSKTKVPLPGWLTSVGEAREEAHIRASSGQSDQ